MNGQNSTTNVARMMAIIIVAVFIAGSLASAVNSQQWNIVPAGTESRDTADRSGEGTELGKSIKDDNAKEIDPTIKDRTDFGSHMPDVSGSPGKDADTSTPVPAKIKDILPDGSSHGKNRIRNSDDISSNKRLMPLDKFGHAPIVQPREKAKHSGQASVYASDDFGSIHAYPKQWVEMAPMPTPRAQLCVVSLTNGTIYAIGGYSVGMTVELATVEMYLPLENRWIKDKNSGGPLAPMPFPTRGAASAVGIDGKIYVFGGTASETQIYNPVKNEWHDGKNAPYATWEMSAATAVDGRIIVFGGENYEDKTRIYDPIVNTWTMGEPMTRGSLQGEAIAAANELIYYIGGYNDTDSTAISNVRAYNPFTNKWLDVSDMPAERCQFAAAIGGDGRIYVYGGSREYGNNAPPHYNTMFIYDPYIDAWSAGTDNHISNRREAGAAYGGNGIIYYIGGGAPMGYVDYNEGYRNDWVINGNRSILYIGGELRVYRDLYIGPKSKLTLYGTDLYLYNSARLCVAGEFRLYNSLPSTYIYGDFIVYPGGIAVFENDDVHISGNALIKNGAYCYVNSTLWQFESPIGTMPYFFVDGVLESYQVPTFPKTVFTTNTVLYNRWSMVVNSTAKLRLYDTEISNAGYSLGLPPYNEIGVRVSSDDSVIARCLFQNNFVDVLFYNSDGTFIDNVATGGIFCSVLSLIDSPQTSSDNWQVNVINNTIAASSSATITIGIVVIATAYAASPIWINGTHTISHNMITNTASHGTGIIMRIEKANVYENVTINNSVKIWNNNITMSASPSHSAIMVSDQCAGDNGHLTHLKSYADIYNNSITNSGISDSILNAIYVETILSGGWGDCIVEVNRNIRNNNITLMQTQYAICNRLSIHPSFGSTTFNEIWSVSRNTVLILDASYVNGGIQYTTDVVLLDWQHTKLYFNSDRFIDNNILIWRKILQTNGINVFESPFARNASVRWNSNTYILNNNLTCNPSYIFTNGIQTVIQASIGSEHGRLFVNNKVIIDGNYVWLGAHSLSAVTCYRLIQMPDDEQQMCGYNETIRITNNHIFLRSNSGSNQAIYSYYAVYNTADSKCGFKSAIYIDGNIILSSITIPLYTSISVYNYKEFSHGNTTSESYVSVSDNYFDYADQLTHAIKVYDDVGYAANGHTSYRCIETYQINRNEMIVKSSYAPIFVESYNRPTNGNNTYLSHSTEINENTITCREFTSYGIWAALYAADCSGDIGAVSKGIYSMRIASNVITMLDGFSHAICLFLNQDAVIGTMFFDITYKIDSNWIYSESTHIIIGSGIIAYLGSYVDDSEKTRLYINRTASTVSGNRISAKYGCTDGIKLSDNIFMGDYQGINLFMKDDIKIQNNILNIFTDHGQRNGIYWYYILQYPSAAPTSSYVSVFNNINISNNVLNYYNQCNYGIRLDVYPEANTYNSSFDIKLSVSKNKINATDYLNNGISSYLQAGGLAYPFITSTLKITEEYNCNVVRAGYYGGSYGLKREINLEQGYGSLDVVQDIVVYYNDIYSLYNSLYEGIVVWGWAYAGVSLKTDARINDNFVYGLVDWAIDVEMGGVVYSGWDNCPTSVEANCKIYDNIVGYAYNSLYLYNYAYTSSAGSPCTSQMNADVHDNYFLYNEYPVYLSSESYSSYSESDSTLIIDFMDNLILTSVYAEYGIDSYCYARNMDYANKSASSHISLNMVENIIRGNYTSASRLNYGVYAYASTEQGYYSTAPVYSVYDLTMIGNAIYRWTGDGSSSPGIGVLAYSDARSQSYTPLSQPSDTRINFISQFNLYDKCTYGVYLASHSHADNPNKAQSRIFADMAGDEISNNTFGVFAVEELTGSAYPENLVSDIAISIQMCDRIWRNAVGIEILGDIASDLNSNVLYMNDVGILVRDSGLNSVSIHENMFHNNTKWAVILSSTKALIDKNNIRYNSNGIAVIGNSRWPVISNNEIVYNFGYGVYIPDRPKINDVDIQGGAPVSLFGGDNGLLLYNDISMSGWLTFSTGFSGDINGVDIYDGSTNYMAAVGDSGTILLTSSHGSHWMRSSAITTADLFDVCICSSDNEYLWAVGSKGTILHSENFGETWYMQDSGTTEDLYSVRFIDVNVGFACGANGTILRTTDSGLTWTQAAAYTNADLFRIDFASYDVGWCAGEGGIILKTIDSGITWFPQSSGTSSNIYGFSALNIGYAYACGEKGLVLATSDGGNTWNKYTTSYGDNLYAIGYDYSYGYVCGENSAIFYSPSWPVPDHWVKQYSLSNVSSFVTVSNNRICWNMDYGIWSGRYSRCEVVSTTQSSFERNDIQVFGNITVEGTMYFIGINAHIGSWWHNQEKIYVADNGHLVSRGSIIDSVHLPYQNTYSYYFEVYGKLTMIESGVSRAYRLVLSDTNTSYIERSTISHNYLDGIYVFRCNPIIISTYIEYNNNNGLLVEGATDFRMTANWFIGNYRGMHAVNSIINATSCVFASNKMEGLYLEHTDAYTRFSVFTQNKRGAVAVSGSTLHATRTSFTSNANIAAYADNSDAILDSGCRIEGNSIGVEACNLAEVSITDSFVDAQAYLDFHAWKSSSITLLDTVFTGHSDVEDTSLLTVRWSLVVFVTDSSNVGVANADVNVTDSSGITAYSGKTGASGKTTKISCVQYIKDSVETKHNTPHTITVSHGKLSRVKSILMNETKYMTISLNHAPVITSLPVTDARQNEPYIYQVTASDSDGDPLTYSISSVPATTISISNSTGMISWIPQSSDVGVVNVIINVSDGYSYTTQQYFMYIENVNDVPIIGALSPLSLDPGKTYIGEFTVTDPDMPFGDSIDVALLAGPDGMVLNIKTIDADAGMLTGQLRWMPQYDGLYSVTLKATDSSGASSIKTFTLGTNEDHAPYVGSVTISPEKGTVETTFTATASDIGDFDGDSVTLNYQWQFFSSNQWQDIPNTNKTTFKPGGLKKGMLIRVVVTPYAYLSVGAPAYSTPVMISNSAPVIQSVEILPKNPTVSDTLTAVVKAFDADNDTLTYSYQWFKNGIAFESAIGRNISAPFFQKGDLLMVQVKAFDGTEYSETVSSGTGLGQPEGILIGNSAPVLTDAKVTPETGDENTEFRFTVTYTDADGDMPKDVVVVIDDINYPMTKVAGVAKTGIIYEFKTTLPRGKHDAQIFASDGEDKAKPSSVMQISVSRTSFDVFWLGVIVVLGIAIIIIIFIDHAIRVPKPVPKKKPSGKSSGREKNTKTAKDTGKNGHVPDDDEKDGYLEKE